MNWDIGLKPYPLDARCQHIFPVLINERTDVVASFGYANPKRRNHDFFAFLRKTVIGRFLRLRFFVDLIRFLFYFTTIFNLKIYLI